MVLLSLITFAAAHCHTNDIMIVRLNFPDFLLPAAAAAAALHVVMLTEKRFSHRILQNASRLKKE